VAASRPPRCESPRAQASAARPPPAGARRSAERAHPTQSRATASLDRARGARPRPRSRPADSDAAATPHTSSSFAVAAANSASVSRPRRPARRLTTASGSPAARSKPPARGLLQPSRPAVTPSHSATARMVSGGRTIAQVRWSRARAARADGPGSSSKGELPSLEQRPGFDGRPRHGGSRRGQGRRDDVPGEPRRPDGERQDRRSGAAGRDRQRSAEEASRSSTETRSCSRTKGGVVDRAGAGVSQQRPEVAGSRVSDHASNTTSTRDMGRLIGCPRERQ
jgi:hypothetical protein